MPAINHMTNEDERLISRKQAEMRESFVADALAASAASKHYQFSRPSGENNDSSGMMFVEVLADNLEVPGI